MLKWINKKRNKKGFTLVELVVVIAILGVLAMIAAPKFAGQTKKAAVSAHNANVKNLEAAATLAIAEGGVPKADVTWEKIDDGAGDYVASKYLQKWPKAPKGIEGTYKVKIGTNADITVTPGLQKIDADGNIDEDK